MLEALAGNRCSAAVFLITLAVDYDRPSLWIKDRFPSSSSTPLILASKTANNEAAFLLVGLSTSTSELNQQDYSGNTALHYACLMRNNALIEDLLLKGADPSIKNHKGDTALHYYELKATALAEPSL
ncbi:MAG: ankyrin repeat domain-containing protein [Gammaproteobacteria bacterium]|nr:ankyrin repeat domain-containing protein [Gammaproteobacteria bacterium]